MIPWPGVMLGLAGVAVGVLWSLRRRRAAALEAAAAEQMAASVVATGLLDAFRALGTLPIDEQRAVAAAYAERLRHAPEAEQRAIRTMLEQHRDHALAAEQGAQLAMLLSALPEPSVASGEPSAGVTGVSA